MSVELEREALDVAKWWGYHRDTNMDFDKKLEFLIKVNDHLLYVLGRVIQDIKNLEHREKWEKEMPSLLLPLGIKFHDGIRAQR